MDIEREATASIASSLVDIVVSRKLVTPVTPGQRGGHKRTGESEEKRQRSDSHLESSMFVS